VSFYVSTATFFLLHCDEWDRVVALPRHKFVTGATLLQLATMLTTADVIIHALIAKYGIDIQIVRPEMTKFKTLSKSKHGFLFCGLQPLDLGIIRAFKARYRKHMPKHLITKIDLCSNNVSLSYY
jgi:hypothetical protein